jgi:hypothetical protein
MSLSREQSRFILRLCAWTDQTKNLPSVGLLTGSQSGSIQINGGGGKKIDLVILHPTVKKKETSKELQLEHSFVWC